MISSCLLSHQRSLQLCLLTFIVQENQAGLNLHLGNTKVMFNEHAKKCKITTDEETIEEVYSYV